MIAPYVDACAPMIADEAKTEQFLAAAIFAGQLPRGSLLPDCKFLIDEIAAFAIRHNANVVVFRWGHRNRVMASFVTPFNSIWHPGRMKPLVTSRFRTEISDKSKN
jgi:hypothetical protein